MNYEFKEAVKLYLDEGTTLRVTFSDGVTKKIDMKLPMEQHPVFKELNNREIFLRGKIISWGGITWTDELDVSSEYIYENGIEVETPKESFASILGFRVAKARWERKYTQKELSDLTGIAQGDISKLEKGQLNPSVNLLYRISTALNKQLSIMFL